MRFELMTSALSEQRSNQLNYLSKNAEHNLRLQRTFPGVPQLTYWVVDRCSSHEFALIQFLCSPNAFLYRARMDAVRYL